MSDTKLTHLTDAGHATMVDISHKAPTARTATARGRVTMHPAALAAILEDKIKKGNVFEVARLAGIMAAKRTSDLIPLCHVLAISKISVDLTPDVENSCIEVEATAKVTGQTGVEMEALTAVSITCLTIYDMVKAVDKGMVIEALRLVQKSGGKSGDYEAH